ncbi:MAG: MarR family transcriptional regulator [Clostridia bacterium]
MRLRCLGRRIKQLNNAFEREANRLLQEHRMTFAQMEMLRIVGEARGAVNQRYIEDALGLKNPTVTGTLNRLAQKGFIRRVVNPEDGRSKLIEVTAQAGVFRARAIETFRAMEAQAFAGFSQAELELFEELLQKAQNNMSLAACAAPSAGMEDEDV